MVVEIFEGADNGFAFCLCLSELDCICKLVLGNINGGFHIPMMDQLESYLHILGFHIPVILPRMNGA